MAILDKQNMAPLRNNEYNAMIGWWRRGWLASLSNNNGNLLFMTLCTNTQLPASFCYNFPVCNQKGYNTREEVNSHCPLNFCPNFMWFTVV